MDVILLLTFMAAVLSSVAYTVVMRAAQSHRLAFGAEISGSELLFSDFTQCWWQIVSPLILCALSSD